MRVHDLKSWHRQIGKLVLDFLLAYLLGAQSIIFELRLGGAHEVAEEEAPIPEVRDLSDVEFVELDILLPL